MVHISYLPEFIKQAKRLSKKYPSFTEDLRSFINELQQNPFVGVDLGGGVRKIRMPIKSKQRGKSGGARVITANLLVDEETIDVTLLNIYDKSERSTISDVEIRELAKKAKV